VRNCAPDLDEEMAAAQANAAREQIQEKARTVDWTKVARRGHRLRRGLPAVRREDAGRQVLPRMRRRACRRRRPAADADTRRGDAEVCPECGARY